MDENERHAITASEMLASLERYERKLENLTPDERLQMTINDGFKRANRSMAYTCNLAIAHALTSIALSLKERPEVVIE
jgi:hypothetical protein